MQSAHVVKGEGVGGVGVGAGVIAHVALHIVWFCVPLGSSVHLPVF